MFIGPGPQVGTESSFNWSFALYLHWQLRLKIKVNFYSYYPCYQAVYRKFISCLKAKEI